MSLIVFNASYSWHGRYGSFQYYEYVIVANTVSEALGLALEQEPSSHVQDWSIGEISTDKVHAVLICRDTN